MAKTKIMISLSLYVFAYCGAVELMMKIDANPALSLYCPPYREISHVHTDLESVEDTRNGSGRFISYIAAEFVFQRD